MISIILLILAIIIELYLTILVEKDCTTGYWTSTASVLMWLFFTIFLSIRLIVMLQQHQT